MSNAAVDWLAAFVIGLIVAGVVIVLAGPLWAAAGFGYLAFTGARDWLSPR